ncbi:MAG: EAL domain-containing protein [Acutalibacteraceae bacterium]|jgi:EAL domain-containing protein (putative c-di-GMP-specific phosphodiesterase class I)
MQNTSENAKAADAKPAEKKPANAKPKQKPKSKRKSPPKQLRRLEMFYQPVFDVHRNMVVDYETSVRINDPKLGVLMPHAYIPVAEKSTQAADLCKWALEEGCDAILRCEKRDVDINRLILFTSMRYLTYKTFARQMIGIVEKKGVAPDKFCFNIEQSIFEEKKDIVLQNIKEVREYGFLVSIDDFGVEYTSLSHLGQYEVDYIGINDSMLDNIQSEERAQNMLQGIIDFARKLETQTRINGVETQEQADFLKAMGIDQMKGKLYGGPMPEKSIK